MTAPAQRKAEPAPRRRCALYTRKSSEEGLEQEFNTLHAQREACEAYVRSQAGEGWVVLPTLYDDGGFSGGNVERPALQRLLADVDAGRIDIVVVYKVDRLTRSLSDFARIVDRFDAKGVSFVSVTQAFNTTTSMGRLTLNVLLSFAQFEREVTGERIRDKLAASKKKGLWMGGTIPLGYDLDGRALKVNETEAELVRHMFNRFLALGTVNGLTAELEVQGVVSKVRISKSGVRSGGVAISRGALLYLLSNRLYRGEIPHKDAHYPGRHPAIVDEHVFEAVQRRLLINAGPKRRALAGLQPLVGNSPLTGKVFDDRGHLMSPVVSRKGKDQTQLYRYYVSGAVIFGSKADAGSLARLPATELEKLVEERAKQLGLIPDDDPDTRLWEGVRRVEVGRGKVVITYAAPETPCPFLADRIRAHGDEVELAGDSLVLTVMAGIKTRGRAKIIASPNGAPAVAAPTIDLTLLKALVRAEAWKLQLLTGEAPTLEALAEAEGIQRSYARRLIRLASLSPSLKAAILHGRTPAGLTLQRLMTRGVPLAWAEQG